MRPNADAYFMEMVGLVSTRSTCVRRSVGCVLVDKRRHVLATGYNGPPSGTLHCNDVQVGSVATAKRLWFPHACPGADAKSGEDLDQCYAVHAEQNAILQCGDVNAIEVAYVTTFPCASCLKLLQNTSCHTITYVDSYNTDVTQWTRAGRVAQRFNGPPHMIQADLVNLFHDRLDEWRMLVACVCLNLCSARVARGVIMRVLARWPDPVSMAAADPTLEGLLRPLGLQVRRAASLRSMSAGWERMPMHQLPGIGSYAIESVEVFCRGALPDAIGDQKVAAWVEWHRR